MTFCDIVRCWQNICRPTYWLLRCVSFQWIYKISPLVIPNIRDVESYRPKVDPEIPLNCLPFSCIYLVNIVYRSFDNCWVQYRFQRPEQVNILYFIYLILHVLAMTSADTSCRMYTSRLSGHYSTGQCARWLTSARRGWATVRPRHTFRLARRRVQSVVTERDSIKRSLIFAVLGACTGPVWTFSKCTSSSLSIRITLHLPAKFCRNRTTRDRIMTSYISFKTAATPSQFYFRFRFSWVWSYGKVDIYLRRKISAWYLNHRPIYYYFRFLKTNVRNVGILLPVPIFTVAF